VNETSTDDDCSCDVEFDSGFRCDIQYRCGQWQVLRYQARRYYRDIRKQYRDIRCNRVYNVQKCAALNVTYTPKSAAPWQAPTLLCLTFLSVLGLYLNLV
jgi:hypothetical protein